MGPNASTALVTALRMSSVDVTSVAAPSAS